MPRGKFEKIRYAYILSNYDKLYKYKIHPLLQIDKKFWFFFPQEEHQSVDKQIIASNGICYVIYK